MSTAGSTAQPHVTVVMRTKDRPRFLARAVASVLAQTFTDFELVVVNDGGDPSAVDGLIAERADSRVRVLHNVEPGGMVAASNRAIRESASELIAVHDDDDTWDPAFLERMTDHLARTGAMAAIATTDIVVERVEDDRVVTVERERLFPGLTSISLYELCFENYATPIAFVYRRAALDAVGGYDEAYGGAADWEFALRYLSQFEIEFLSTEQALAFYHHRPGASGIDANSVYTAEHRRLESRVANDLLRGDLAAGKLGLGLVVNMLRHDYESGESLFARQKIAIDERIEYLASCVAKVDQRVEALQQAITPAERLKSDLAFLRGIPKRLTRRSRH